MATDAWAHCITSMTRVSAAMVLVMQHKQVLVIDGEEFQLFHHLSIAKTVEHRKYLNPQSNSAHKVLISPTSHGVSMLSKKARKGQRETRTRYQSTENKIKYMFQWHSNDLRLFIIIYLLTHSLHRTRQKWLGLCIGFVSKQPLS